ncbi:hypothetical protein B0H11DRAFT_1924607 [Mycena galericulata]|nr:hypothetical protein B0H11DRAFT_1924607 [Mycena galericulata]
MWLPSEPKAKRTFEKLAQPQNIISLCETLVSMPSVKDALVPVTFDMLGRVAILRALLVLYPDETTYWEKVDARLLKIRTKADNDRAAISRAIGKMLKADQEAYGPVDVEPILAAAVQPPGDEMILMTRRNQPLEVPAFDTFIPPSPPIIIPACARFSMSFI